MSDEHDAELDGRDDSGILPVVDDGHRHDEHPAAYAGGARRAKKKRGRGASGCLAALVALAVVAGLLYVGVTAGLDRLRDQFADPEDYTGPGTGDVTFEVAAGENGSDICRKLEAEGVVASVDACINAVNGNEQAASIQVGFYALQKEMASSDAIDQLVDPANLVTTTVTIPEGLRLTDIVAALAEGTEFPAKQFTKVLDDPAALAELGLPDYANGNAEGYLFPATYAFGPNDKPGDMIQTMIARWQQAADDAGLEERAAELGYTAAELMTVASLVEAEGRGDDMPKIARVIYNRIENPGTAGTVGLLQIDATVNYAAGNTLGAVPTTEDLELDSPYNTYQNTGLPPGPIEAPGDDAIAAAANPADGDWYYYVTVNLATGETKFAETSDEFLTYKNELRDYCATESEGAC